MTDPYAYFDNTNNGPSVNIGGKSRSSPAPAPNDWFVYNNNNAVDNTSGTGVSVQGASVYPDIAAENSWPQYDYSSQNFGSPGSIANGSQVQGNSYNYNYAAHSNDGSAYYYNQSQSQPNMFIPHIPTMGQSQNNGFGDSLENEPPLLEELGINFDHIRQKTLAVLNPIGSATADVIADQDLAGPLVFCLLFGASLLLHGKIHFGYIYGIALLGSVGMYALLNLMAEDDQSISFTCTVSVLGYCLLPMALLSMLAAVLSLQGFVGYGFSLSAVVWSGWSSSKLFSITLRMQGQRILVAYPCTILYSVFALLAIF